MSKINSYTLNPKDSAVIDDLAKYLVLDLESYLDFQIQKIIWFRISEFITCDK